MMDDLTIDVGFFARVAGAITVIAAAAALLVTPFRRRFEAIEKRMDALDIHHDTQGLVNERAKAKDDQLAEQLVSNRETIIALRSDIRTLSDAVIDLRVLIATQLGLAQKISPKKHG